MSETHIDTIQARPRDAAAAQADGGLGKHRGQAASEETQAPAHGRHRRPNENAS
ncbi:MULTISPECIES: hypothetical protein [Streptomyces]|uniref:DUF5302 domain-containing protein n=1 Tax=Streptomyces demainii TaxID=588122 RepID=A0ABT9KSC7_9ACTN|nr:MULTISPECIES: hypothetical protein [Streptomyces]MBW8089994.1 hypothetical protein [Streptomyces hygroscopicus subsp. hygroscopicus]MCO8303567.1 hypothetical protein [Streptomyces sp. RKCA744]MDN3059558.1 hypothetical protein [Streptomyces sp. SRF1]MDP9610447.1 hypothetical protein [Streptomyces demainii]